MGCWNPPKKDTPGPKTKKKLHQDGRRGAITIKSNPIPVGWVTHKLENNNIKEVSHCVKVLNPTSGFPAWESNKGTGNSQGIWPWKPAGLHYIHRTRRTKDFSLGGHKLTFVHTKTQRKGVVIPQETEPKLPATVGSFPEETWVSTGLPQGRGTGSSSLGRSPLA